MKSHRKPRRAERGASGVEYALLIAFVAAIVVAGIVAVGEGLPALYELAF